MSIVDRRTALVTGLASASIISSMGAFADEKGEPLRKSGFVSWELNYRKSQHPSQTMYQRRGLATWSSLLAQVPAIRMALGHRGKLVVM